MMVDGVVCSSTGVLHSIRNMQNEYRSGRRRNVWLAETHCGRHFEFDGREARGIIDCLTCRKAVKAENRRTAKP